MYVTRHHPLVAAGKAAEYEARTARLFDLYRSQPGFLFAQLDQSLGQPARYCVIRHWESREAAREFQLRESQSTFVNDNPLQGLATSLRPFEAHEVVSRCIGDSVPAFTARVDWAIDSGKQAAFEQSRADLASLLLEHVPGLAEYRLERYLGNQSAYVVRSANATLDGLRSSFGQPAIQAFVKDHPTALYTSTPLVTDFFVNVLHT